MFVVHKNLSLCGAASRNIGRNSGTQGLSAMSPTWARMEDPGRGRHVIIVIVIVDFVVGVTICQVSL